VRLPAALFAFVVTTAWAAPDRSLSTRETYEVSLARTSGYLLTAHGRTIVETRTGCGGTHTLQRSIADVTYKDGQPIRTDFVIDMWERSDGRTLRFHVRNAQSGDATEMHDGTAKLLGNGGHVTFTSHDKPFALPKGAIFPAAFGRAMLEAAAKTHDLGGRIVFQGGGRKALVTAAVKIGHRLASPHEGARDSAGLLRKTSAWPILISYFPANAELPASEVAAHLYANGLLGSLSLVYPDFTLRAKLVRIERLPSSC